MPKVIDIDMRNPNKDYYTGPDKSNTLGLSSFAPLEALRSSTEKKIIRHQRLSSDRSENMQYMLAMLMRIQSQTLALSEKLEEVERMNIYLLEKLQAMNFHKNKKKNIISKFFKKFF